MSNLLDEWAQELKDTYGEQITSKIKRQIKRNTTALIHTIKNKEIDFGEFTEEINMYIARISYLKRVLRSMLSEDLEVYQDYLRACIKEAYKTEHTCDETSLMAVLEKYDRTRAIRLRKLKGILLRKISKYSS
jgi:hypothetical protein